MIYDLSAVGGEAFYDTDNNDGLAKSSKHPLHSTEIQRVKTFPPSVAKRFTTPTMLMASKYVKTPITE